MMRRIVQGKEAPWIFHMRKFVICMCISNNEMLFHEALLAYIDWTASIEDKLRYMKQFGIWYIEDNCTVNGEVDSEICCSATPVVTCTYLDLPSVEQCKGKKHESLRNKGASSFW